MSLRRPRRPKLVLGWREWLALPDLGIEAIKAKLDTGARSSALHAYHIERFERDGVAMVRFRVHPMQREPGRTVVAESELADERWITSSSGHRTLRPVVVTTVELAGERWPIELTLTSRDAMGFRMLLGRQALRRRFVVDPGRSYVTGRLGRGARPRTEAPR